jgi:hypothetical protein
METWLCSPPFYYFNITSALCQTLCGKFTYENTTAFICEPCQNTLCYECTQTDKSICTDCASYLFYELVNNTCACMGGYFPTNSICMPCSNASTGCLTCSYNDGANGTLTYSSSNFTCLTCNSSLNYVLNGVLCQLCTLSNCVNCLNLTACAVCNATLGYFSNGTTCMAKCGDGIKLPL